MTENDVTTPEQVDALPAGQWVIAADGTEACLFDTHMGFPQHMWGIRHDAGRPVGSFTAMANLPLPLHLADVIENAGHLCQHRRANECGQCLRCGLPDVGERHELFLDAEGLRAFRIAAEHNAALSRTNPTEGTDHA
jgi:hypothetical protein